MKNVHDTVELKFEMDDFRKLWSANCKAANCKAKHFFLYNLVLKVYSTYGRSLNKNTVSNFFWHYFCNQYTEESKCTWRIVCKSGNCNINQKLMNLDN